MVERVLGINHVGQLADLAVHSPDLSLEQKVEILETTDIHERYGKLIDWMGDVLGGLNLRRKVRDDASERMEKSQREYILRQQLEAIRSELGEGDEDVVAEYRTKLAEADMPGAVLENVTREIDRLERMSEQSPEHSWIRTWLDSVFELPWNEMTSDNLELADARAVLDADHTGLEDVKERIVEHLAVRKLRAERETEGNSKAPLCCWLVLRGSARLPWVSPWPGLSVVSLCGWHWVGCATKQRSGDTDVRTSAPALVELRAPWSTQAP